LAALEKRGYAVAIVDPRGVGTLRPDLAVKGRDYADPLNGVEENIAYNAFLVGKTLLGMRVSDVVAAVKKLAAERKPSRIVLRGRRGAALVACFAAAVDPTITHVALQEMPLTYRLFFDSAGRPINAASVVPNLLRDFGDIGDALADIAPRKVLVAAGLGKTATRPATVEFRERGFTEATGVLIDFLLDGVCRESPQGDGHLVAVRFGSVITHQKPSLSFAV